MNSYLKFAFWYLTVWVTTPQELLVMSVSRHSLALFPWCRALDTVKNSREGQHCHPKFEKHCVFASNLHFLNKGRSIYHVTGISLMPRSFCIGWDTISFFGNYIIISYGFHMNIARKSIASNCGCHIPSHQFFLLLPISS
jgi:hypothetical protein